MKKGSKETPWPTQIRKKDATILMLVEERLQMITTFIFAFSVFSKCICKINIC